MPEPTPVSFGKGSNKGRTGQEGLAEFVNAYLEKRGETGKAPFVAYARPGLVNFATLGTDSADAVRAVFDLDTILLTVAGRRLYSLTAAGGAAAFVGGIPADGLVTMAANRAAPHRQVVIVCDGLYFTYQNGVLTVGSDPDLPPPIAVIEKGGFFIFLIADGRVFFTDVNDITVDPLDLLEANANADGLIMGVVRGPDAIFAGPKSLEFWQLAAGGAVPFSRGMSIDMGCWAAGSMQKVTVQVNDKLVDSIIWAATDHKGQLAGMYVLDGFTPIKISTSEVDRLLRGEADPKLIRSAAWTEEGKAFYVISGANWTRTYDTGVGEWYNWRSADSSKWKCGVHAHFSGLAVFGDQATNKLYVARPDVLDDMGEPIQWQIITPPVHMWPKGFKVPAVYVDALTGVGINSADEDQSNPILFIDYTRDGGQSWAAQRQTRLGPQGQRWVRIKERGFGKFDHNGMTLRLSAFASAVKGIQGMAVTVEPLGS